MGDGDALLAAVLANPDEDTPRLVYADWLQENDQPERAEFIRGQVDVAVVEASLGYLTPASGRRQGAARGEWLGELPGLELFEGNRYGTFPGDTRVGWRRQHVPGSPPQPEIVAEFRRGFVAEVRCTGNDWFKHAAAILAAHPVRRVTLTAWPRPNGRSLEEAFEVNRRVNPDSPADYGTVAGFISELWPAIAFTLPPTQAAFDAVIATVMRDGLRDERDRRVIDMALAGIISATSAAEHFGITLEPFAG
jgi:uncharacterized protein (TIGR02996 family)